MDGDPGSGTASNDHPFEEKPEITEESQNPDSPSATYGRTSAVAEEVVEDDEDDEEEDEDDEEEDELEEETAEKEGD